jgi:hypothetical protein
MEVVVSKDWRDKEIIGCLIRETLFDTGKIDPGVCEESVISAARQLHPQFSQLDEDSFFIAFRRSATEYQLKKDLDKVNSRHYNLGYAQPSPLVPHCHSTTTKTNTGPSRGQVKVSDFISSMCCLPIIHHAH